MMYNFETESELLKLMMKYNISSDELIFRRKAEMKNIDNFYEFCESRFDLIVKYINTDNVDYVGFHFVEFMWDYPGEIRKVLYIVKKFTPKLLKGIKERLDNG